MKHLFTFIFLFVGSILNCFGQLKPMPGFYPEGVFKREQRIKTTYTTTASTPKEVYTNMRSVGKAFVLKPGYRQDKSVTENYQKGKQHIEFTFTEISGIKSIDGVIKDLGNPIEDFTVYAYRANYNNNGESIEWDGKKIYMDAMENGNLHIIEPSFQCTYFLHNDKARNVGDIWIDSQFAFPLTRRLTTQLTFEKMEKNEYGVEVCRLGVKGDVKVNDYVNVLGTTKLVDLKGSITAFIQVDPNNNQIHRFKGEIKLSGKIEKSENVFEPYEVLMKVNEWSMNPSNNHK